MQLFAIPVLRMGRGGGGSFIFLPLLTLYHEAVLTILFETLNSI